jgi:hypothetical protein
MTLMMKAIVWSFETSHSLIAWFSWILGSTAHCSDNLPAWHFSHHIFTHFVTGLTVKHFPVTSGFPVVWPNIWKVQRIKYIISFMQVDSGWPDQPDYPRNVAAWWFRCSSNLSDKSTETDWWLTNGTKWMSQHLLALHTWKVSECQNLFVLLLINYSKLKSVNRSELQ